MDGFWQEIRLAWRLLGKQPAFVAVAVFMLALGIGANTAIFSVVNAVLLRPLPFEHPERLMAIWERDVRTVGENFGEWSAISYPDFRDWKAQNQVFDGVAVYSTNSLTLTDGHEATHIQGESVSNDLFTLLGVQPVLGRNFLPQEDEPGNHVVILSHAFYQQRFGGNPSIIGKSIILDGQPFHVLGVMPSGFQFPIQNTPIDAWTTVSSLRESRSGGPPMTEQRGNDFMSCIARLKSGVSVDQAQANLETIAAAIRKQYPDSNSYVGVKVVSLLSAVAGDARSGLIMLCGMAGCVLLAACVNVANLLLARSLSRQKEISVRAALGAGRRHIIRQLLTESTLLALLGGGVGLFVAIWGVDVLKSFLPADVPRVREISTDGRVLLFTMMVSLFVGLIAGLLPAWRCSHPNLLRSLSEGSRGSTEGFRGRRTRGLLVIIEVVLTLVLLASAGLLTQSFLLLHRVAPGFDPTNVLTARIGLPDATYQKPEQATQFFQDLQTRIARLPGVEAVSSAWWLPLTGSEVTFDTEIEEHPLPKGQLPVVQVDSVGLDFFKTLRVPLRSGRTFTVQDDMKAPLVAIVTESFARRFFPGEDPIGKRIKPNGSVTPGEPPFRQIVGVVGDSRFVSLGQDPKPAVYVPHAQFPVQGMSLIMRTSGDPNTFVNSLRRSVNEIDKDVPVFRSRPFSDYVDKSVAQPRFHAILVSLFSTVALLLAAGGIFGVMSYAVTQRTQEIGIRLALGAQRFDVLRLVIGEGMRLVGLGVGAGLVVVFVCAQLLRGLLYGIGPTHFPTLIGVSILLSVVALVACWWPARRASGVDPVIALREG
jgi:putative ABC transport system permease protein